MTLRIQESVVSDRIEVSEQVTVVEIDDSTVEVVEVAQQGPPGPPGDPASNLVTSVAGKQGAVTLSKSDVRLETVDNTADADKPVSGATQTALNSKLDRSTAAMRVCAVDGSGAQVNYPYAFAATGSTLAQRDASGRLNVADPSATTHAATKAYVDTQDALKATDAGVVHNTGDETVSGLKTFTTGPVVPSPSKATELPTAATWTQWTP